MTDERINEAMEELKRVDHLIYVSLKYTRTVDVILNILGRMVDAYSLIMDALIEHGKTKGNISSEPESAVEKAELVRSVFQNDDVVVDNASLYLLLRKLLRARNVERENEYRRHVTMKTIIEGREEIVNIDIITNYYLFLREFLAHTRGIIEGHGVVELRDQTFDQPHAPAWMDAREEYDEDKEDDEPIRVAVTRTPPVKAAVKIRSVTAPPRKRVPRPKKYKIQIPKGKDPIMRPPYEHDPKYNMALRQEAKKPVLKKAVKTKKPTKPSKHAKQIKQTRSAKQTKQPRPARNPPKSKLRRTVNSLTRALRKAASKKKT